MKKKQKAPKFKVGETWNLRLGTELMTVRIIDRTPKVIEVVPAGFYGASSLYEIADLDFVEKVTV